MFDEQKKASEETRTEEDAGAAPAEVNKLEDDGEGALDLENLDLSVETVEERISPSETNVFDK